MGICSRSRELKPGLCEQTREVGWGGSREGGSKQRGHMYTYVYIAPHILRYGRNQHNVLKQLSSD